MLPKTRDEFEVAIICALPLEAGAVLDSFDQRYDKNGSKYGKQEGDTNTYSTGRIGPHHVVLAHMPGMGISSSARVASNIRLSFQRIRLTLIVGVCGGAPFERPTPAIVLGDVIISNSVVEFDFGKLYPNRFERKIDLDDTLGRPNPEIRGLLSKFGVQAVREELEYTLLENLRRMQDKRRTAKYPGVEHDRLFPASYRHMHRGESASQHCPCDSSKPNGDTLCSRALESSCDTLGCIVDALDSPSRQIRFASGAPTPFVHIGTIGSANTVMKSGEHRDAIARENNLIAFEMEGAGVWDTLPCVVIKGVCDYADSHKNKIWQDYAAATAASAAKAFLDHWIPRQHNTTLDRGSPSERWSSLSSEDVFNTSNTVRHSPHLERQSATRSALPVADHTSTGFRPLPMFVEPPERKIRLDALNFEQLDARQATIKTAHAATCGWLLSKSEYLDWQSEDKTPDHHGFLWIKGKPGAGKSTIMNFAYINAIQNSGGSVVISYFFNARGASLEKSTIGMYRSLLFQLLSDVPRLQEILDTKKAINSQAVSPDAWTAETLQLLFRRAIGKLEDQRLTCFVDALDECEDNEDQVREMVRFFEELGECATTKKTRFLVCFSSRHYPHITIDKCVRLILEDQQGHSEDITRYIDSRLKVERSNVVEQIKSKMHEKAQGVFLWVVLVVPMLQKAYDHGRVHALSKCLESLPKGLDELFEDILTRDTENIGDLKACLKWILYAFSPLTPRELYFAILTTSSSAPATAWNSEDVTTADINKFILSSSKGFAESTSSIYPTIQFIHESVRDFLLKENGSALQADIGLASAGLVHDFLKDSCQRYLLSIPSSRLIPADKKRGFVRENETRFPFLRYSIRSVFEHAESAARLGVPQEKFLEGFPLSDWIYLHDCIEQFKIHRHSGTSLLYVLTEMNLLHLFQIEVCRSQSINSKGGRYDFPIIAAAVVGNEQMLALLLQYGADHTKSGSQYTHVLYAAIDKGNASAVTMLMNHGAVPAAQKVSDHMVKQAVIYRETATIKLLLENPSLLESSASSEPRLSEDLVHIAIRNGDQRMLKLFLKFGVISKTDRPQLNRALYKASKNAGNEALVLMLIEHGADVNAVGPDAETLLGAAVRSGREALVRLLIEKGADVNARDTDFGSTRATALYFASRGGQQSIVRMLLQHGADANKDCPLLIDASTAITRTLLKYGADPNQGKVHRCGTTYLPLHLALKWGRPSTVRLLLDYGADVNISSSRHTNAFSALDSCPDPEQRARCERLFRERSLVRPEASDLIWYDCVEYLDSSHKE